MLTGFVSAQAQTFSGAVSSDPTVAGNYSTGAPPAFGTTITATTTLTIKNVGHNDFVYSSSLGTTVFDGYLYDSSTNNGNGLGTFDITGGSVSFGGTKTASGNQNSIADGILNVSGGTITFLNGNTGDNDSLWFGNSNGPGTANVTGGTIITQNGLLLDRDGTTSGTVNISSGLFNVEGTTGTTFGKKATINLSGGTFEESASNTLGFTTANGAGVTSYINFTLNSTGVLSLFDATTSYLTALVTSGDIFSNGVQDKNLGDFAIAGNDSGNPGQGTLELATVPEPSTWALLAGGSVVLVVIQRKRSIQS